MIRLYKGYRHDLNIPTKPLLIISLNKKFFILWIHLIKSPYTHAKISCLIEPKLWEKF